MSKPRSAREIEKIIKEDPNKGGHTGERVLDYLKSGVVPGPDLDTCFRELKVGEHFMWGGVENIRIADITTGCPPASGIVNAVDYNGRSSRYGPDFMVRRVEPKEKMVEEKYATIPIDQATPGHFYKTLYPGAGPYLRINDDGTVTAFNPYPEGSKFRFLSAHEMNTVPISAMSHVLLLRESIGEAPATVAYLAEKLPQERRKQFEDTLANIKQLQDDNFRAGQRLSTMQATVYALFAHLTGEPGY